MILNKVNTSLVPPAVSTEAETRITVSFPGDDAPKKREAVRKEVDVAYTRFTDIGPIEAVLDGLGAPGGMALAAGTVAALTGAYLSLCLLMLVSRVPWLEREVGHDRMVRWHRSVAPWALVLIVAHVALTTVGYGQASEQNVVRQLWTLVTGYAWMVPATRRQSTSASSLTSSSGSRLSEGPRGLRTTPPFAARNR